MPSTTLKTSVHRLVPPGPVAEQVERAVRVRRENPTSETLRRLTLAVTSATRLVEQADLCQLVVDVVESHVPINLDGPGTGYDHLVQRVTITRHRSGRVERQGQWFDVDGRVRATLWDTCCTATICQDLAPMVREYLGPFAKASTCIPLAGQMGLTPTQLDWLPRGFTGAFDKTTTVAQLVNKLFGEHNHRRDLVAAVAKAAPTLTCLAWMLHQSQPDTPIDWVTAFLRRNQGVEVDIETDHARALSHLDPKSVRRLLNADLTATTGQGRNNELVALEDLARVLADVADTSSLQSATSWSNLEQQAITLSNMARIDKIRAQAKKQVDLEQANADWLAGPGGQQWLATVEQERLRAVQAQEQARLAKLEGVRLTHAVRCQAAERVMRALPGTHGDHEVRLPVDAEELKQWSQQMHTCIKSYGQRLEDFRSVLFAVHELDGEMVANGEFTIGDNGTVHLSQLLGKYNKPWDWPPAITQLINQLSTDN